jgi:polyhydroxybutyrate depolymerase
MSRPTPNQAVGRVALAAALSVAALATADCAAASGAGALQRDAVNVAGMRRTYLLYVPASIPASRPASLVLLFHGGFGSGADAARRIGMNAVADRAGFVVAYPDGVDKHWNDGRETTADGADDVAFVAALVEHIRARHAIDPRRIYATGLSNGGYFTLRLACERADLFAAVAPVMSTFPEPLHARCRPARPLPLLLIGGTADPLVPWNGGELTRVRNLGGKGGRVISVRDTIEFWRGHNGCAAGGRETALPDRDPDDGTRVMKTQYGSCRDDAEVMLLAVEGGGHTWPGAPDRPRIKHLVGRTSRDIDASEIIWEFFSRHPGAAQPAARATASASRGE